MAAGDREKTFTLRAADLSSQPIKDVVAQVDKLIASQKALNEAAKAGTISTKDYSAGITALNAGFTALVNQKSQLNDFLRLQGGVESATAKAAAAADRFAEASAKAYGGLDTYTVITAKQATALERLEKSVDSANKRLAQTQSTVDQAAKTLETYGITASEVTSAQATLTAAIEKSIPALKEARIEELNLNENRRASIAVSEAAAAAKKREADADQAFVLANRKANEERATSLEAGRIAAKEAEAESARAARVRYENIFAEIDAEKALQKSREDAARTAAVAADALKASQQRIAQATSTLPGTQAPGQAQNVPSNFSEASQAVAGLADPARAARSTLEGLGEQVDKVAASMTGTKKRVEDYQKDIRDLVVLFADLGKIANATDLFKNQAADLARLGTEVDKERASLAALQAQESKLTVVDLELEKRILAQTAAVRKSEEAYNQQNIKLSQTQAALQKAGVDYNNIDATVAKLTETANKAKAAYDIADKAKGGKNGDGTVFLGLRGYELQNLSYQINDVFTQLGSGTKVSQVFAQQFGQIFQLFQRDAASAISKLKEMPVTLAAIGATAVVTTVAIYALVRSFEIDSSKRSFAAQLALDVDGARISIDKLIETSKGLTKYGIGTAEGIDAAKSFAGKGFDQKQIEQLLKLAAILTGSGKFSNLGDAVKELSADFGGGYKELTKFLDITNSFDAALADQIRKLFEAGKSEEAYALAVEEASKRAEAAHEKSVTAIGNLYRGLKTVFQGVGDAFTKYVIEPTANSLLRIAEISDGFKNKPGQYGSHGFGDQPPTNTSPNGGSQALGESRGDRNNSPGNLEFARQENAGRENGDSGRFARFLDLESGTAAALRQYLLYQDRGKQSVKDLVETATPPKSKGGDNPDADVARYVKAVSDALKVGINDPINLRNRETAEKYLQAVSKQEGNSVIPDKALRVGVDRVLGPSDVTSGANQGQQRVQADFLKGFNDDTAKLQDNRLTGEDSIERENKIIADQISKAREAYAAYAKEHNQTVKETADFENALNARTAALQQQYANSRLEKERGVNEAIKEGRSKAAEADATDLKARQAATNADFDSIRDRVKQNFSGTGGAQSANGKNLDQSLADVETLRQAALSNDAFKAAQATLDKVTEARKQAIELGKQAGETGAKLSDTILKANEKFGPQIKDAVAALQAAASKVPNTPTVQASLGKATGVLTDLTGAQSDSNSALQDGLDRTQKQIGALFQARNNRIAEIDRLEQSGQLTVAQGLAKYQEVTSETLPGLQKAVEAGNAALKAIASNPAASLELRNAAQAAITKNLSDLSDTQKQLNTVLTSGLKDTAEKLTAEKADRDAQKEEILRQFSAGLLSVTEASGKLSDVSKSFSDKIKADAQKVVANLQAALATPGLQPGQKAELQGQLIAAQRDAASNRPDLDAQRQLASAALGRIGQAASGIKDTESGNAQLVQKGLITQTAAEESNKRAHEDAVKATAEDLDGLNSIIDKLKELGASASEIEKIQAKMKLLGADISYVNPLLGQLQQGLEQSIAGRGEQAFDTIAKGIADVAVNGGKLKDVFAAVGQAFAQFAAGVLQDIAKIIIKYELLKLVKDALGSSNSGGGFTSDGSGAGFAPEDSSGIDGASGGDSTAQDASTAIQIVGQIAKIASQSFHTGGEVTSAGSGVRKPVDMSLFYNARRMHDGGVVGLANDEVPAILQRGERVQSVNEVKQAAMAAWAGGNGGGTPIRNVLAVGDDEISKAMNGSHGEQVVLNHLRRNAPTVRKLIGG